MKNRKLENIKYDYEHIPVPDDLRRRVDTAIHEAKKEENQMEKSKAVQYIRRIAEGAAAALIIITILANSGASIAHAMTKVPVIGAIAEIVTFREYRNTENNM